jgi:Tfp pilus assembly protein PilP
MIMSGMKCLFAVTSVLLYILASAFLLSGCDSQSRQQEIQHYITQLKLNAAQSQAVNNTTVWTLPKPVKYTAGEAPGITNQSENSAAPLQSYSIKQLQFVGILTQDNITSAYILAPDGMLYLVKMGDVIGDKYGKIVKIDSDHIEISEKYTSANNQSAERTVTMELKD